MTQATGGGAMKIAVFFVGEVHDAGFNASALAGAEASRSLADIMIISGVRYDQDAIRERLAEVAPKVDGLVFIGGQGNITTPEVAAKYPDKRFAIVQGHSLGPNLASYDVRQEDSAFLAGVLAAKLTRTGTVGHLSGHRVPPGLKGRAAFVAGVAHESPQTKVLTGFCGTQDDSQVTRAWASAEIAAGADIIFTMLNGARTGAIQACRLGGAHQIGNALDWVTVEPDVFVGSAIARIDLGVMRAISDMAKHVTPDQVVEFGLADGDFVALSMSVAVSSEVRGRVAEAAEGIRTGKISIPHSYDGAEFQPEGIPCAMEG